MKDFLAFAWAVLMGVGAWVTTVILFGVVLKLNAYIFSWGWNLV